MLIKSITIFNNHVCLRHLFLFGWGVIKLGYGNKKDVGESFATYPTDWPSHCHSQG